MDPTFDDRQSESILKDQLQNVEEGVREYLNAPSVVDTILRKFASDRLDDYKAYLAGKARRDEIEAAARIAAREVQDVMFGRKPDLYVAGAWNAPDQLGRHILSFGPLADRPEEAVYGLMGHFASALLKAADQVDEVPDGQWQGEFDALFENYAAILLGHPPRPQ